jgi:hypothetical protein
MAAQLAAKLAPLSPLTCSVALLTPVKSSNRPGRRRDEHFFYRRTFLAPYQGLASSKATFCFLGRPPSLGDSMLVVPINCATTPALALGGMP